MNESFESVIASHARRRPASFAFHAPGRQSMTYQGLLESICAVREHLNVHGIGRGDRVGLFMPSRPHSLVAYLSTACSATAVPLNPDLTEFELDRILPALKLNAAIVAGERPDLAAIACRHSIPAIIASSEAGDRAGVFRLQGGVRGAARMSGPAQADDFACVLSSSGTTGRPKAGRFLHRTLLFRAEAESRVLGLTASDITINFRPTHLSGALNIGLLATIWSGGAIVVPPRFDPDEFFRDIVEFGVTWYTGGPAHHRAILDRLDQNREALSRSKLRFVRSAGYALSPALQENLETSFGVPCIQKYGSSEAGPISCNPMPPGLRKPGTTGVVQDCEVRLVDPDGNDTNEGEIIVKGAGVFSGYDDEALNREAFMGEWFRTGDVGFFDESGYLVISGRLKEIINKGGHKISPQEVEGAFLAHPGVSDALCFPIRHKTLGQTAGIAIVASQEKAPSLMELREFVAGRLADFKLPAVIIQTEKIPEAISGKRSRVLAADYFNLSQLQDDLQGSFSGPGKPPSGRLEEIWSDALKLPLVDDAQNFTLMGGDSLSAIRLIMAVEEAFGISLDASVIYGEGATLGALKTLIGSQPEKSGDASRYPEFPRRPDGDVELPLTSSQWRLWSICKLSPHVPLYNNAFGIRFRGPLDTGAISNAVNYVISRHEALRATFNEMDGTPRQLFHPPGQLPVGLVDMRSQSAADQLSKARELAGRPYDLEYGPLVRADIILTIDNEALLVFQMHHLVTDGRSSAIIAEQLVEAWTAFAAGKELPANEPGPQFGDYVAWRTANIAQDEKDRLIAFWLDEIGNASGDLGALAERPRRQVPTYRGERIRIRISKEVCDGLRRIAAEANVTLFVTALAAFEVLIKRLSGQGDFVISTVVDNRPAKVRELLVGFLLNTIPIRARFGHDTTFIDYLHFASGRMARILAHSEVPFDRLVQKAGYRREGLTSLKQVMFGFMPKESRAKQWDSATFEPFNFDHSRAHFDLSFVLAEAGGEIEGHVEFSTDVFDQPGVERIISRFKTLLGEILADPQRHVDDFQILPDDERALISAYCGGKVSPYPRDASVPEVFKETATAFPDNVAIAHGDEEITYQQLDKWSDRLATLLHDRGLASGDVVAISAERTPALVAGLLGILKSAGTYLAIEPGLPENRVRHIIHASGARLFLAQGEVHPGAAGVAALSIPAGSDSDLTSGAPPRPPLGSEDIGYICYTSGSTGIPKGALISHRSILRLVKGADYAQLGPDERILQLSSVAFDASTFEIWVALLNGGTLVQPKVGQPTISELANTIMEEGITTLWMTAGLFHKVVDLRLDCFRQVRQVLAGGDVLSADHVRKFLAAHPRCTFVNGYGPTENTTFSTCCAVRLADLENGAVPIGRPIANSTAYVLDERLRVLPLGVEGDLYVGGDGVAQGYLNMPAETQTLFLDDPFSNEPGARMYRTGDRARMLPDGKLDFRGRKDTQIKIRGFRVELQEIETVLRRNPAIADAVVVPRREEGGAVRSLAAFVMPASGGATVDSASVRRLVSSELPEYMVPGEIIAVGAFPLTSNGKVDRKALLEISAGGPPEQVYEAPRTPVEKLLAGIWTELLEIEKISIDDDFFDLGGHSLLVLQLAMRLEEEIALSMDYGDFFRFPTIRMLSVEITERLLLLEEKQAFATAAAEHPHV